MFCVIVVSEGPTYFKARICRIGEISKTKVDFERNLKMNLFAPLHNYLLLNQSAVNL